MEYGVAYLFQEIKGSWRHHPILAEFTLKTLCDCLVHDGYVRNYTLASGREFGFPYAVEKEIEVLYRNGFINSVACTKTWADAMRSVHGYYVARVVVKSLSVQNRYCKDFYGTLLCYLEMHGTQSTIVTKRF